MTENPDPTSDSSDTEGTGPRYAGLTSEDPAAAARRETPDGGEEGEQAGPSGTGTSGTRYAGLTSEDPEEGKRRGDG